MHSWCRLVIVACLSVYAGMSTAMVNPAQLQTRLAQIAPLAERGLDFQAYQREASYQLENLSTPERARLEAQIFTARIQAATLFTYDKALEDLGDPAQAVAAVREYVAADIINVSPALSSYVSSITDLVLANPANASVVASEFPAALISFFADQSEVRQQILADFDNTPTVSHNINKSGSVTNHTNPSSGNNLDSSSRGVRSYRTRAQLLQALVSGDESERWVATANMSHRTQWEVVAEVEFSGQVKVSFLGSEISGGPVIKFKVEYSVAVDIKGEGSYPIFDSRGFFDLDWKGANGRPVLRDGRPQRRFVFMTCDARAQISSEAGLGGTLKVFGVGTEATGSSRWTETAEASSRRVLVPDTVDGVQPTRASMTNLCLGQYLNARAQNGQTIRRNLLVQLRNSASSLVYSNPGMQCVRDNHCTNWFNNKWRINRMNAVPRCVQANGNLGLMTCQTRGRAGASCPLASSGWTNVGSLGVLEHRCDTGFQCVRVASMPLAGGLLPLTVSHGVCQPNPHRR